MSSQQYRAAQRQDGRGDSQQPTRWQIGPGFFLLRDHATGGFGGKTGTTGSGIGDGRGSGCVRRWRASLAAVALCFRTSGCRRRNCCTASVPREVLLPSGPPDRQCKSRSGTSFEASHICQPRPPEILSQTAGHRQSFPPSTQPQRIGRVASSSSVTQLQRDRKNREGNAEGNAGF